MPFESPRHERILDSQEKKLEVCKEIEELPLFETDRMFILLTYFREKPASSFRIGILKDAPESEQQAFLRKKETIENALKKANLFFTIKETENLEDIGGTKEKERSALKKEVVLDFLHFTPPAENRREELETVRKWQKIVKEKTPKLYEEIRRGGHGRVLWTGD